MLANQFSVDASAPACPWIFRMQARARHVKVEVGILLLKLAEFVVENDVVRGAHAVEHGDARFQCAPRRFANKSAKGRHSASASNADQMFVRLVEGQKSARWRNYGK